MGREQQLLRGASPSTHAVACLAPLCTSPLWSKSRAPPTRLMRAPHSTAQKGLGNRLSSQIPICYRETQRPPWFVCSLGNTGSAQPKPSREHRTTAEGQGLVRALSGSKGYSQDKTAPHRARPSAGSHFLGSSMKDDASFGWTLPLGDLCPMQGWGIIQGLWDETLTLFPSTQQNIQY